MELTRLSASPIGLSLEFVGNAFGIDGIQGRWG